MIFKNDSINEKDLGGGVIRKVLAYKDNLMIAELRFDKGSSGAMHSHPHEQIGYVISGKLVYKEEGADDRILTTGDSYYVEPNCMHGVDILEDTKLLDVFTPMRSDLI